MARRSTAQDVANLAGVSRSAVSLVLNGRAKGFVSKETQRRIEEAASTLGYSPNLIARSLRDQRSRVIGIVSNQAVTSPFDGEIIAGAQAVARDHGFMIFASDTEYDEDGGSGTIQSLLDRSVEGLVYLTVGLHETSVLESMLSCPAALANCYPDAGSPEGAHRLSAFIPDELAGGRTAAEHLIALGHHRIALLRGEADSPASWLREQGFREAMTAAGLPVREQWVIQGGFQVAAGYQAAAAVLDAAAQDRPTAILAGNDRAAIGAVLAAAHLGLEVPRDLSIVGYDNERLLAESMIPALTTIALPLFEMGRLAMESVLAQIDPANHPHPPAPAGRTLIACPLVTRDSAGEAPA